MCSCPSRTDEPYEGEGHNQSPNHLSADLTTNQDLNGIANTREIRNRAAHAIPGSSHALNDSISAAPNEPPGGGVVLGEKSPDGLSIGRLGGAGAGRDGDSKVAAVEVVAAPFGSSSPSNGGSIRKDQSRLARLKQVLFTYAQFVGPGFMIAVAYS